MEYGPTQAVARPRPGRNRAVYDLDIAPEVARATAVATPVVSGVAGAYECPACGGQGEPGSDPSSVILIRSASPAADILALAHTACMPSQVLEAGRVRVRPVCDPISYAWITRHGPGPHARMVLDYPHGIPIATSPAKPLTSCSPACSRREWSSSRQVTPQRHAAPRS